MLKFSTTYLYDNSTYNLKNKREINFYIFCKYNIFNYTLSYLSKTKMMFELAQSWTSQFLNKFFDF